MCKELRQCWATSVVAGLGIIAASSPSQADVVTVGAVQDSMIFATSAGVDTGNASGKGPGMFAGTDGQKNIKRSLIEFDLASAHIPANATVTSVVMTLYLGQIAGSGGGGSDGSTYPTRIFSLYDLRQAWSEGSSGSPTSTSIGGNVQGAPRVAGDSTWDYANFDPNNTTSGTWNFAGTNLHGGNFSPTASATSTFTFTAGVTVPANSPYTWSSAGMAADVQSWISGATPNNGWLLKSDNLESSATSFLGFWTKDGAAANDNLTIAPSLSITYTPEPGSLLLLALTPLLLLPRRRTPSAGVHND